MAGIGFELKKLFSRRGLFASFRAYGYAGIICTGPMLLGIVLLLGVMFLCDRTGASKQSRELLVCMITYTLLASLTVTSFLSMVVTRFIADMLYEEKNEAVLSSFWGSTGLMLIAGGILYGIFLIFSGVGLIDKFLCFELFGELIVTWNAMSYLTAIKDYRGIMLSFLAAIAVTFLSGALLLFLGISHVEALMAAVCIGYGIMLLWDVVLLYEYFPQSDISAFLFLRWADEFLPLAFTGLCINIGLFAHLVIMWAGPLGKQVKGLFYGAPSHDVPALIAFLTILITTVNFVVSVEVNFYPKYRNYYSLFNDGGTIKDIMQAGTEMLDVLNRELKYTALKQLLTTALAISMGESLLKYLPLGFNDLMYGYFRTLCVGYGIYAVTNTMSRPMRATARLARCLWELSKSGKIRVVDIYRQMAFGNQTDKEFSIPGNKWRNYVETTRTASPILKKDMVNKIIENGYIEKLSPERRFDQTLYFTVRNQA